MNKRNKSFYDAVNIIWTQKNITNSLSKIVPTIYSDRHLPFHTLNHFKGHLTEELMTKYFENEKWLSITSKIGNKGIDGIYLQSQNDKVIQMLVAEAKYGSSRLGHTLSGRQMGDGWITERLADVNKLYKNYAKKISSQNIIRVSKGYKVDALNIPMDNGEIVKIWESRNQIKIFSKTEYLNIEELKKKLLKLGKQMETGKYDSVVFRYNLKNHRHTVTIEINNKNVIEINNNFDQLPKDIQKVIKQSLKKTLKRFIRSESEVNKLSDEICKNPEILKKITLKPSWSIKHGLNKELFSSSLKVAGAIIAFDITIQLFGKEKIDIARSSKRGSLLGASYFLGRYSACQTSSFLCTTKIGQNIKKVLSIRNISTISWASRIGGGIAATTFLSYGCYWLGLIDAKSAHRDAFTGVLATTSGTAAYYGGLSLAMTYGTASTGTAISTLSGITANNAALAWLGGGSLANGGGGVALGTRILAGGAVGTIVVVGVVAYKIFSLIDEADQRLMIEGYLDIAQRNLV